MTAAFGGSLADSSHSSVVMQRTQHQLGRPQSDQFGDVLSAVSEFGWCTLHATPNNETSLSTLVLQIATSIGTPIPTRGRTLIDSLRPTASSNARPRSLSARYGKGIQPWHSDTVHQLVPARHLVFACLDPGEAGACTVLADWKTIIKGRDTLIAARTEPFLIRCGRHSFYSTVQQPGRPFTRFDPGCMEPCRQAGRELQSAVEGASPGEATTVDWKAGQVVIIDNWRMAHRRLDAEGSPGRTLLRVSVAGRS